MEYERNSEVFEVRGVVNENKQLRFGWISGVILQGIGLVSAGYSVVKYFEKL